MPEDKEVIAHASAALAGCLPAGQACKAKGLRRDHLAFSAAAMAALQAAENSCTPSRSPVKPSLAAQTTVPQPAAPVRIVGDHGCLLPILPGARCRWVCVHVPGDDRAGTGGARCQGASAAASHSTSRMTARQAGTGLTTTGWRWPCRDTTARYRCNGSHSSRAKRAYCKAAMV